MEITWTHRNHSSWHWAVFGGGACWCPGQFTQQRKAHQRQRRRCWEVLLHILQECARCTVRFLHVCWLQSGHVARLSLCSPAHCSLPLARSLRGSLHLHLTKLRVRAELIIKTMARGSHRPADELSKLIPVGAAIIAKCVLAERGRRAVLQDAGKLDVIVMTAPGPTHSYSGAGVGLIWESSASFL